MKISISIECNTVAEAQQILAQLNAQAPAAVQQSIALARVDASERKTVVRIDDKLASRRKAEAYQQFIEMTIEDRMRRIFERLYSDG